MHIDLPLSINFAHGLRSTPHTYPTHRDEIMCSFAGQGVVCLLACLFILVSCDQVSCRPGWLKLTTNEAEGDLELGPLLSAATAGRDHQASLVGP